MLESVPVNAVDVAAALLHVGATRTRSPGSRTPFTLWTPALAACWSTRRGTAGRRLCTIRLKPFAA
jgi:hypothetical protein